MVLRERIAIELAHTGHANACVLHAVAVRPEDRERAPEPCEQIRNAACGRPSSLWAQSYRRGVYLAAASLLGAAVEGAWYAADQRLRLRPTLADQLLARAEARAASGAGQAAAGGQSRPSSARSVPANGPG